MSLLDGTGKEWATDSTAKITSKGQVTIPKRVRDALELHEGDELLFRVDTEPGSDAAAPMTVLEAAR